MRYRYLDDFRRGISVFAIFSYGIAVLDTPQCPPLLTKKLTCSFLLGVYIITELTLNYHWFTVNCSCNSFDVCCIKTSGIDFFSIECIRKNMPDLTHAFHLQHSPPFYPVSSFPLTSGPDTRVKPVRNQDSRYEIEHGLN